MLIKENIYILIFFEGPADGLGDTTITAEAKYSSKVNRSKNKIR